MSGDEAGTLGGTLTDYLRSHLPRSRTRTVGHLPQPRHRQGHGGDDDGPPAERGCVPPGLVIAQRACPLRPAGPPP